MKFERVMKEEIAFIPDDDLTCDRLPFYKAANIYVTMKKYRKLPGYIGITYGGWYVIIEELVHKNGS